MSGQPGDQRQEHRADQSSQRTQLSAPAKLTLSLRVTGVRPDGYHLISSEMVSLDLADTLVVEPGEGLVISAGAEGATGGEGTVAPVTVGPDNLVSRALAAVDRTARVELIKRIPPGAGLGGGSSDAAAILRWAGRPDTGVAVGLGADVPFCLNGGRALVAGIGEVLQPLPYREQSFILLLPPFGVSTVAVYRMWDQLHQEARLPSPEFTHNELEAPALAVEPRLELWRQLLADATGREPRLAGSGSTWFVEGSPADVGLDGQEWLERGPERARVLGVRTVPAFG